MSELSDAQIFLAMAGLPHSLVHLLIADMVSEMIERPVILRTDDHS